MVEYENAPNHYWYEERRVYWAAERQLGQQHRKRLDTFRRDVSGRP